MTPEEETAARSHLSWIQRAVRESLDEILAELLEVRCPGIDPIIVSLLDLQRMVAALPNQDPAGQLPPVGDE